MYLPRLKYTAPVENEAMSALLSFKDFEELTLRKRILFSRLNHPNQYYII